MQALSPIPAKFVANGIFETVALNGQLIGAMISCCDRRLSTMPMPDGQPVFAGETSKRGLVLKIHRIQQEKIEHNTLFFRKARGKVPTA